MSTWHQAKNPQPLWHHELWTVVIDPPNGLMSIERFRDPVDAQRAAERHKHAYVIPPSRGQR